MKQILSTGQYVNRLQIRNNRIAAGLIFNIQALSMLFHGWFTRPQSSIPSQYDVAELFTVTGTALLVIIGFGFIFSPTKNNMWSSLGFTFLIVVFTYNFYPLVNTFWTMAGVTPYNTSLEWSQTYSVYLSDQVGNQVRTYGNTAVGALKCGLANAIGFAGVMGRAGPLQAILIAIGGTIGYQINRQLVLKYTIDFGGSISIFCFGGVFGALNSLVLYWLSHKKTAQQHQLRIAGKFSYSMTAVGSLFIFVFFPIFGSDIPSEYIYDSQASLSTFYSICTSTLTCVGLSCLFNGKMSLKDFVYGPVVGGVIVGSSNAMIGNEAGAMLLGAFGGLLHFLLGQIQTEIKWYFLVQNNVLFIYGVQGMFGGFLSAIFIQIARANHRDLYSSIPAPYSLPATNGPFKAVGITLSIAFLTGLLTSFLVFFVNKNTKTDHYHDRAYWVIEQDCISYEPDIHLSQEGEKEESSQEANGKVQIYQEVVVPQEKDFKNKFAEV